jgi:hypothetical protein
MDQTRRSRELITAAACACRFAGRAGAGSRAGLPRRRRGPGGMVGLFAAAVAVLAALGVPGVSQSAAVASSASVMTWAKQAPATHPSARCCASMAYDAATGTVVLFGGSGYPVTPRTYGDTWTWDGTTWTLQHPAASPPPEYDAAMAYDPATGTVVLFGGDNLHRRLGDTWLWGSN